MIPELDALAGWVLPPLRAQLAPISVVFLVFYPLQKGLFVLLPRSSHANEHAASPDADFTFMD